MGATQSAEEPETGSEHGEEEVQNKSFGTKAVHNFFSIFSNIRNDETLDSTDSDITLEDFAHLDKRRSSDKKSVDNKQSVGDQDLGRISGNGVVQDLWDSKGKNLSSGQLSGANSGKISLEELLSKQVADAVAEELKRRSGVDSKDGEGMRGYQRYSREPAEKDHQGLTDCPVPHNMKSCCRSCCEPLQKSLEAVRNSGNNTCYQHNCPRRQAKVQFCRNRLSDSYVSCRNPACLEHKSANPSKSAPLQEVSKPYPSESRIVSDPKNDIPLPPPPPAKQESPSRLQRESSLSKKQSLDRKNSGQQQIEHGKQMYNPHNYNYNKQHHQHQQQQQQQQHYKAYPYEEPTESTTYSHDTCCSHNCNGYEHCAQHRSCRCQCMCEPDYYNRNNVSDDQISCSSESTKTDFMNLAYQRTGDYPELVDELENTLSQRNRMRVQKTMQQFEMLSRQNKNLDKPIFDDEESVNLRQNHGQPSRKHRPSANHHQHQIQAQTECKCGCCKPGQHNYHQKTENYKSRSESLSKRPSFQPTPFPRSSGYVEKVARYMDPNFNEKSQKYPKQQHHHQQQQMNGSGSWQMDSRKGEWVKVGQNHPYDFENNYPPLPARPRSGHLYEDRNRHSDYSEPHADHSCACNKCCSRRNR